MKLEFTKEEIENYGLKIPTDEEIDSMLNDLQERRRKSKRDLEMLTSTIDVHGPSCCVFLTDSCGDGRPFICENT